MRAVATSRKTDYKYLTSYLDWKKQEGNKAERTAKSLNRQISSVEVLNDKGLDELVKAKDDLEGDRKDYKIRFEKFVAENESDATAMSTQKRKLEDILGDGYYIDSYSLMRELIRKYIVVVENYVE